MQWPRGLAGLIHHSHHLSPFFHHFVQRYRKNGVYPDGGVNLQSKRMERKNDEQCAVDGTMFAVLKHRPTGSLSVFASDNSDDENLRLAECEISAIPIYSQRLEELNF